MDRVTIWLDFQNEDAVEDWLWTQGALSVEVPAKHDPDRRLIALFNELNETHFTSGLALTFGSAQFSKVKFEEVIEDAWQEAWKADFKPLQIGRFSLIGEWEAPENVTENVILIYPGQAFGTGRHETTQMLIEALERVDPAGKTVLDAGCGTGILAIAAEKLGAAKVFGFDVDPDCEENMQHHLRINDSKRVSLAVGVLEDFSMASHDLILANITINVLREIWSGLSELLNPGGLLLSSGILATQRQEAEAALANAGLVVHDVREQGEWIMIEAGKA